MLNYKTKVQRRAAKRRERLNRLERIGLYTDKIDMLRGMIAEREDSDDPVDLASIARLTARIRELEQMIRYTTTR